MEVIQIYIRKQKCWENTKVWQIYIGRKGLPLLELGILQKIQKSMWREREKKNDAELDSAENNEEQDIMNSDNGEVVWRLHRKVGKKIPEFRIKYLVFSTFLMFIELLSLVPSVSTYVAWERQDYAMLCDQ